MESPAIEYSKSFIDSLPSYQKPDLTTELDGEVRCSWNCRYHKIILEATFYRSWSEPFSLFHYSPLGGVEGHGTPGMHALRDLLNSYFPAPVAKPKQESLLDSLKNFLYEE